MSITPTITKASATPKLEHPVYWIESDTQLAELCGQWRQLEMIAVDTEFMRSQTYYPKPALIQINDGSGNYLIDPLTIDDFAPMVALLTDTSVIKVLHSCSEDLEVFQTLLGTVPQNIFDTQAAAALLGHGFSLGYAGLVKRVLNIELPKGETRSNWLQRPLSQAQRLYAAIDVEYLLIVAEKLRQKLEELGRWSWLQEDAANLAASLPTNQDPESFYLRIKSAWKLNRSELAILKSLAAWRETVAQRRDVPRNRVVKEHVLLSLAQQKPQHVGELRKYEGMTDRVIRADGETIINLIEAALASDESDWPEVLPRPLMPESSAMMKSLKAEVQALAEKLNVAPESLLRKRDYETLVRDAMAAAKTGKPIILPGNLCGWRDEVVGQHLLQVLARQRDAETNDEPGETTGPAENPAGKEE